MLDLLGGLLARVPIEAPSANEQAAILAALFPDMGPVIPTAMETLAVMHAAAAVAADRRAASGATVHAVSGCPVPSCHLKTAALVITRVRAQ